MIITPVYPESHFSTFGSIRVFKNWRPASLSVLNISLYRCSNCPWGGDTESLGIKKKRKVSLNTVWYGSGVLGSPWIIFFIRPRRLLGFTDKRISVHPGLSSLLEWHRSRFGEVFVYIVIQTSALENCPCEWETKNKKELINWAECPARFPVQLLFHQHWLFNAFSLAAGF